MHPGRDLALNQQSMNRDFSLIGVRLRSISEDNTARRSRLSQSSRLGIA